MARNQFDPPAANALLTKRPLENAWLNRIVRFLRRWPIIGTIVVAVSGLAVWSGAAASIMIWLNAPLPAGLIVLLLGLVVVMFVVLDAFAPSDSLWTSLLRWADFQTRP